MEEILTFQGSHGTSASRAEHIRTRGWTISSGGLHGNGVYFWKECDYYLLLAHGWYNQVKAKFSRDGDQSCKIIIARLTAKVSEVFDLEQSDFKEKIYSAAKARKFDYNKRDLVAVLAEWFVKESERKLNTNFKILLTRVQPPKAEYCKDYPRLIFYSGPECLIARNVTCIQIVRIESCPDARYA